LRGAAPLSRPRRIRIFPTNPEKLSPSYKIQERI
jgi:hypothetical protein